MNNSAAAKITGVIAAVFKRPLAIILVAVVIIALLLLTRPGLEPVLLEERVWPVQVTQVFRRDEQPVMELFGEVVAGRRSELRALVPGRIVATGVNFSEGARIAQGDLLVEIDPFDYRNDVAEQKALYAEARVRMSTVERDLKRIRDLYNENNVSEQSLDDALLAVEQQSAVLEQHRISLARAERALRDTRLTAPYDGVVHEVSADVGKQLGINDKVAEVIDTGKLEVRFSLSNAQFGRAIENAEPIAGRPVSVAWQVGSEVLKFNATLQRIGAEIDPTTGGVDIYAELDKQDQTPLRPGAFVWISMNDKVYSNVFKAPDSALYGEDTLFVVRNDRMESRRIKVLGYSGAEMLFASAGDTPIVDGDQVVITQIREGGEGVRVSIRE